MKQSKGLFRGLFRGKGEGARLATASISDGAIKFVDVPSNVPTLFADSCIFVTSVGPTARLQFVEMVPGALDSTDPGAKLRYVFNVAMPHDGLVNMVQYILSILPEDVRKGIVDGL